MTIALAATALAWSALVAAVSGVAIARSLRACASARARARVTYLPLADPGAVVLVRPCAGTEPWLDETLTSVLRARRSFPLSVRFAVASAGDGAVPAAARAVEVLRAAGIDARVVLTAARGPNHKSAQVARALEGERPAVVLVADSDVDLAGTDLDALLSPLADPAVAAAWAPPVETAAITRADRASVAVLGGSLHAFPLLAGIDPAGLVGKLVALRASALDAAGGFASLRHHLGEDMELARRLRALGGSVTAVPQVARSRIAGRNWPAVVSRYARWLAVIRAQRTPLLASYPLLFAATPWIVLLALAGAHGAQGAPGIALAAALLAVAARLAVALAAQHAAGRPPGISAALADAVLADGLLTVAFLRALASRRFTWRGRLLVIQPDGTVLEAHTKFMSILPL